MHDARSLDDARYRCMRAGPHGAVNGTIVWRQRVMMSRVWPVQTIALTELDFGVRMVGESYVPGWVGEREGMWSGVEWVGTMTNTMRSAISARNSQLRK